MSDSEMDAVVQEFLIESYEALNKIDQDLVLLEREPSSKAIWDQILRIMHSLKGTCGFLGFGHLESVTHSGESLVTKLRDGVVNLDSSVISILLRLVDATRQMLDIIESSGNDGEQDYSELVAQMDIIKDGGKIEVIDLVPTSISCDDKSNTSQCNTKDPAIASIMKDINEASNAKEVIANMLPQASEGMVLQVEQNDDLSDMSSVNMSSLEVGQRASSLGVKVSDSAIRVDVELLDRLMNLVGELVLTRNQMLRFASEIEDAVFTSSTQMLNIITSELQEGVMKTRMQPVGNLWDKLPRVVRDIAKMSGKEVRLEMEGKETELDKTLLESIKDPLTHIIRNCVDHGLETPNDRVKAGKPVEGVITLKAGHESGYVSIEIIDDGRGIDPEKVKSKAIERNLITFEKSQKMSEREILNMIFLPGFSTAEQVTRISGRGVGMDVVKTNLERINGSVDIQSSLGKGTSLKMKIPLTLAIIPALIVESIGQRYAIPQVHLLEVVRIEASEAYKAIEFVQDAAVYRLRNRLLPLVDLNNELGTSALEMRQGLIRKKTNNQTANIVVLQIESHHFGLVVDQILDSQEIVVKPLSKQLKSIPEYAGAAVMGDGRIALILDVAGFAQRAKIVEEGLESDTVERDSDTSNLTVAALGKGFDNKEQLLLLRIGSNKRVAIPLSRVSRLEEFSKEQIEKSGNMPVIQYRGDILPLLNLQEMFSDCCDIDYKEESDILNSKFLNVVVCANEGKESGLIVDEILDITNEEFCTKGASNRDGIQGSAILENKVTDLLDLDYVMNCAGR